LKGQEMGSEKESSQAFKNVLFPKIFRTFRIAIYRNNLIIAFNYLPGGLAYGL